MKKQRERAILYEKRRKDTFALSRRANILRKAIRNLPLLPLEKPIHDGWKRYFVVREDLPERLKRDLQVVLSKINTVYFCRDKRFLHKNRKTNKLEPIIQHLNYLTPQNFLELDSRYQKYFSLTYKKTRYTREPIKCYTFNRPRLFVFRVRPSFITHIKVEDGDLRSEQHWVENKLYGPVPLPEFRYGNATRYKDYYYNEKLKEKRQKQKLFNEQLNELDL